jgi:hypothetical protein
VKPFCWQKAIAEFASVLQILIAEQLFQLIARRDLPLVRFALRSPNPPDKLEIFAEISEIFFEDRFGATFAALLRHPRLVMRAIQTNAKIGAAFHARLAASRRAGQRPWFTAIVTMPRHSHLRFMIYDLRLRAKNQPLK